MTRNIPKHAMGIGLRISHYKEIFEEPPTIDFFEIISENFMFSDGLPKRNLEKILKDYPVVLHGTSMGIGSVDALDENYLKALKALVEFTETPYFTDHLCWEAAHGNHFHDLLPLPHTEKNAQFLAHKIAKVQDYIGRPFGIENLSSYVEFSTSEMNEYEFYNRVIELSGAHYMLDINNIFVSSVNHQFDAKKYLESIAWDRVLQCHIAGHTKNEDGTILDTHDAPVCDEVWELYEYAWKISGGFRTLLEWDDQIPSLDRTLEELNKVKPLQTSYRIEIETPEFSKANNFQQDEKATQELSEFQLQFGKAMSEPIDFSSGAFEFQTQNYPSKLSEVLIPRHGLSGTDRMRVYNQQYWYRLLTILQNEFPIAAKELSLWTFNQWAAKYIQENPSKSPSLNDLSKAFLSFLKTQNLENLDKIIEIVEVESWFNRSIHLAKEDGLQQLEQSEILARVASGLKLSQHSFVHEENWNVAEVFLESRKGNRDVPFAKRSGRWLFHRSATSIHVLELDAAALFLLQEFEKSSLLDTALSQMEQTLTADDLEGVEHKISGWFEEWVRLNVLVPA